MPIASTSGGNNINNNFTSKNYEEPKTKKQNVPTEAMTLSSVQQQEQAVIGNSDNVAARHIDISSSAYDEGQHIGDVGGVGNVGGTNNNNNIGSKFFKTMDPNFHQAPADDFDDSDDIIRDIAEEDERKADADSAYAYYMKMSRDSTPAEERPAVAAAPRSQDVVGGSFLGTPLLSSGMSDMGGGNFDGTENQQQHIGRPIGSPTDMLISKRGSVTSAEKVLVKSKNFKNQKPSGQNSDEKVGQKRGPKATKMKVAASKKRNQSIANDEKEKLKTKSNSQSADRITANNQSNQSGNQIKSAESVQSKSTMDKDNKKKSQSGERRNRKNQSELANEKRNNKEILEVVDLSRSPTSSFWNNTNSFVEKDDLILSYAKRYRNTGRLVADFSNGPQNAKLLVYDLNFEGERQREEKRKRDAILGSPKPQRGRSHDDLIRETIELISKRSHLLHSASHEKMVDVEAEKRMIGKYYEI